MTYATNSPEDKLVLRLQARKSFALGMWIQDQNDGPLDITGCQIRIVMRKTVPSTVVDDSGNLITNSMATILAPTLGFARFELQASDLDHKAGDYVYTIAMVDATGYSTTLANGPLELEQNTEYSSVGSIYTPEDAMSQALTINLRDRTVLKIRTGPSLAPGEATFTHALEDKLLALYAGAVDSDGLLTADDIPDGVNHVMMTTAERAMLADLSTDWDDITGKPNFGTAALEDVEFFLQPGQVQGSDIVSGTIDKDRIPFVKDLRGFTVTTSAPPGGNPGVIYLKYTP